MVWSEGPSLEFALTYPLSASTFITAVTTLLPLFSSCQFNAISIFLDNVTWNWPDHTPETWKSVDNALLRHYPSLPCFYAIFPTQFPYHDRLTSYYGCIDSIVCTWFPQTASKGVTSAIFRSLAVEDNLVPCVAQSCPLHQSKYVHILQLRSFSTLTMVFGAP